MKQFACGDVVPGCAHTFRGDEQQILEAVALHARDVHGLPDVSDELVAQVRSNMRLAA